ncbi:molybdopterin-dependent oxidoreductase [Glaciihabitans sp. dw_435]|uniref:molybdopterin-dependent oxidoreductase n=1 Tax=Glaciihabitans sp. dw_435 TaxID=2720081 RepID=UPI001BD63361|nr:molybdopterin-dependent oxidoreductase [Glaciihabitans sp. dw_435]
MTPRRTTLLSALIGVVSAISTLALAELAALFLAPASSPLLAVGSWIIDITPQWVKELAIGIFGTNDKIFLITVLGIVVLALALLVGVLEYRRPPWGIVILVAVGIIAAIAVMTRAQATSIWPAPTVIGVVGGVLVLRLSIIRLHNWVAFANGSTRRDADFTRSTRRSFITFVGSTAAVALVVGVVSRTMNAGTNAVNAARAAIKLPAPATSAVPLATGESLDVPGISPLVSANVDFYRIDTAIQVPAIDAATWTLKITGMVENEIEISFADLLALPLQEDYVTLTCVSNEVGGNLIGNALWLGYPIRELLARAVPTAGADMVLSHSIDGFTASTPLEVLQDTARNSILAVGMNGEPLPIEHGYPVRMVVSGLYGYVSATKWVVELEVTRFADATSYWTDNGWSDHGPIKTSSRIDVPTNGASVDAGTVAVAGVAWSQHTGITKVQVRVDKGSWVDARLADAISKDTWRQWVYEWPAKKGAHVIEVRATDASGKTQSGIPVNVVPDGAEGWHSIDVRVD